ncbi:MAG: putative metallopeptidase [Patescibacteria group bacterium]
MKKSSARVDWEKAPDIKVRVRHLSKTIDLDWVRISKIYCFRSRNSKSRAHARIWGLSRVWQQALNTKPAYIIEVLSEKFDNLSDVEKDNVLLHELAHIPKNFSGSLLPHVRKKGKRNFHDRVDRLVKRYYYAKKHK